MGVRDQLARLEKKVRGTCLLPAEADDRCPRCGQSGLREPTAEQLLPPDGPAWATADEAAAAYAALCAGRAWLCWCSSCGLVPAGQHDPDWPRQWGASDYSPGFGRHLRDLDLLRAVQTFLAEAALADSGCRAEPQPTRPPRPPDALLGEGEEWVWTDEEGDGDVEATEANPGEVG
jgi:hypothetical protein